MSGPYYFHGINGLLSGFKAEISHQCPYYPSEVVASLRDRDKMVSKPLFLGCVRPPEPPPPPPLYPAQFNPGTQFLNQNSYPYITETKSTDSPLTYTHSNFPHPMNGYGGYFTDWGTTAEKPPFFYNYSPYESYTTALQSPFSSPPPTPLSIPTLNTPQSTVQQVHGFGNLLNTKENYVEQKVFDRSSERENLINFAVMDNCDGVFVKSSEKGNHCYEFLEGNFMTHGDMVEIVMSTLKGDILNWFQNSKSCINECEADEGKIVDQNRNGEATTENEVWDLNEFIYKKQTSTVRKFYEDLIALLPMVESCCEGLTELMVVDIFMNGLKHEIHESMDNCQPQSLLEALELAEYEENRIMKTVKNLGLQEVSVESNGVTIEEADEIVHVDKCVEEKNYLLESLNVFKSDHMFPAKNGIENKYVNGFYASKNSRFDDSDVKVMQSLISCLLKQGDKKTVRDEKAVIMNEMNVLIFDPGGKDNAIEANETDNGNLCLSNESSEMRIGVDEENSVQNHTALALFERTHPDGVKLTPEVESGVEAIRVSVPVLEVAVAKEKRDGDDYSVNGAIGLVKLWTARTNGGVAVCYQHEDMFWAPAIGKKIETFPTDGGDAVVNLWHDSIIADKEKSFWEEDRSVLRGQELDKNEVAHQIEKVLCTFEKEAWRLLLEYDREWNVKPKPYRVSQSAFFQIFRTVSLIVNLTTASKNSGSEGLCIEGVQRVKTSILKLGVVVTLSCSGQKVKYVEERDPQVDLKFRLTGPALIGESFIVPACVDRFHFWKFKPKHKDARQCKYLELPIFTLRNDHVLINWGTPTIYSLVDSQKSNEAFSLLFTGCGGNNDAQFVSNLMPMETSVECNSIISCYSHHGYNEKILVLYSKMLDLSVRVNFKLSILSSVYERKWETTDDGQNAFEKIVHMNVISWDALIAAYENHDRRMEAIQLVKRMPVKWCGSVAIVVFDPGGTIITSATLDVAAKNLNLNFFIVHKRRNNFGILMDAGICAVCGEIFFGADSGHTREKYDIWTILAWFFVITYKNKENLNGGELSWTWIGNADQQQLRTLRQKQLRMGLLLCDDRRSKRNLIVPEDAHVLAMLILYLALRAGSNFVPVLSVYDAVRNWKNAILFAVNSVKYKKSCIFLWLVRLFSYNILVLNILVLNIHRLWCFLFFFKTALRTRLLKRWGLSELGRVAWL